MPFMGRLSQVAASKRPGARVLLRAERGAPAARARCALRLPRGLRRAQRNGSGRASVSRKAGGLPRAAAANGLRLARVLGVLARPLALAGDGLCARLGARAVTRLRRRGGAVPWFQYRYHAKSREPALGSLPTMKVIVDPERV